MKLRNEFTVQAPREQAWPVLLDIPRVAACLPGAELEAPQGDGVYRGRMKVKLGPITTTYEGTITLRDVDEDAHTASIEVRARELKGQGAATATITNRLERSATGTRVQVETDLSVTGRPAQLGRGLLEEVASSMLQDFATQIERELTTVDGVGPSTRGDVMDLGSTAAGALVRRYLPATAIAVLAIWLVGSASRRRMHNR
jgi:carbon monoxide dehydrogenase subunit G